MPRYAAIDIGSNSVRMEAAEVIDGQPPRILASERQVTRLGASVFRTGRVSQESMELLCGILANMATIYKRIDVMGVRAVATAAVRDATDQQELLARASAALGSEWKSSPARKKHASSTWAYRAAGRIPKSAF